MTLMTNDLNDHFLGGREKGETQNRRRFSLLPTGPHGTCDGIAGNGGPAGEEREEREKN